MLRSNKAKIPQTSNTRSKESLWHFWMWTKFVNERWDKAGFSRRGDVHPYKYLTHGDIKVLLFKAFPPLTSICVPTDAARPVNLWVTRIAKPQFDALTGKLAIWFWGLPSFMGLHGDFWPMYRYGFDGLCQLEKEILSMWAVIQLSTLPIVHIYTVSAFHRVIKTFTCCIIIIIIVPIRCVRPYPPMTPSVLAIPRGHPRTIYTAGASHLCSLLSVPP